ncbi:MAG: tetratricopeptide repeat protein [Bacteroidales bacterium]|nr:tetratricopeptide repeat protein [Bacteroidales bacterium]
MSKRIIELMLAAVVLLTVNIGARAGVSEELDSLISVAEKSPELKRCRVYNEISWLMRNSDPELGLHYGKEALAIAIRVSDYNEMARAYSFIGVCHRNMARYSEAFDSYNQGLEVAVAHNLRDQEAYLLVDLGNLYIYHGDYTRAKKELTEAAKIAEEINEQSILGFCHLNLGRVELGLGNYMESELHLKMSLKIRKESHAEAASIAVVKKYLGDLAGRQGQYQKALDYYKDATSGEGVLTDLGLLSGIYENMTKAYIHLGKYDEAQQYAEKCLEKSEEMGMSTNVNRAYRLLGTVYEKKGDYKTAIEKYDVVLAYSDTIMQKETSARLANMEYRLDKMRKEREIEMMLKEKELRNSYFLSLGIFLVMLLGLAVLLISRNVQMRRVNRVLESQKAEISNQKDMLERQNEDLDRQRTKLIAQKKEITDSIEYARRIQYALLPNTDFLKRYFRDGFVFYKPRDVVSGDFYWMFDDEKYFAMIAADCTGHGVPGALMSMLGISALNEIVVRNGERKSADVMNKLREEVKKLLHQDPNDDTTPQDGMDAALVIIDKRTHTLDFSGAYLSLLCIRGEEQITLDSVHNPVGVFIKEVPFTSESLKLEKGDKIYLSSDGYPSQFGGPRNKKLKQSGFVSEIIKNSGLSMKEQGIEIERYLTKWMGDNAQTDDVLVIGVEV